jgi:hypothetical protein
LGEAVTLAEFVAKYPPRPPKRTAANDDENRRLGVPDGVLTVGPAPFPATAAVHPKSDAIDQGRHLWVFVQTSIPAIK